jgi:arsenite methyltransferase
LSAGQCGLAQGAAGAAGLAARVSFTAGDAETLPYPETGFDAVVCECAFCAVPDKPTAATELARVLRPGGRVCRDSVHEPTNSPELKGPPLMKRRVM